MGSRKKFPEDKFMQAWAWNSSNFWSKIVKLSDSECWTWRGSNSPYGPLFGAMKLQTTGVYKKQMTQARRILFAEVHGRTLNQREGVFHTCHNKHCMNPHHLSLELQRKPHEECKKPGPKPREVILKTKINGQIDKLNNLNIHCEAN